MEISPISKKEAARYMGVKGEPDRAVTELLDKAEKLVREKIRPKYVYIETDVSFTDAGVMLGAMSAPLTGEDIRRHLSGCNKAILMAVTLSQEVRQPDKVQNMAFQSRLRRSAAFIAEKLFARTECTAAYRSYSDRKQPFDTIKIRDSDHRYIRQTC